MIDQAEATRQAGRVLGNADPNLREAVILRLAELLEDPPAELLEVYQAETGKQAPPRPLPPGAIHMLDRIAELEDPLGPLGTNRTERGITVKRVRAPLGTLLCPVSAPSQALEAVALGLRTGNAVLWRSSATPRADGVLDDLVHRALDDAGLPAPAVNRLDPDQEFPPLVQRPDLIDAVLPLGDPETAARLSRTATVPVLGPRGTLCHTYVDGAANTRAALKTILEATAGTDSPLRTNTVLVHESLASVLIEPLVEALLEKGIQVRAGEAARRRAPQADPASKDTWTTVTAQEAGLRVVGGLDEAIQHVNEHASGLADAILSEDEDAVARFKDETDAGIVLANLSTTSATGDQLGLDHEVAKSTSSIPAKGPLPLDALTTTRWHIQR